MRRVIMLVGVCAFLAGCLFTGAYAQSQVTISNNENMLDISLRDADLPTVLTALFDTVGPKYKVQFGNGVNGRVAILQLSRVTFDQALDAILGTDFSYTKKQQSDGISLYTISGRGTAPGIGAGSTRMPVFQAPAIGMPSFGDDDVPVSAFSPAAAATRGPATPPLLTLGTGGATPTAAAAADTAASESTRVRLVKVNYLDVGTLSQYLGGTYVDLFSLILGQNGGNGRNSGYGNNNNNNNRYGNNNNRNNNNNYNNGNNNNYNNNNNNNRNNRNNNNNNNRYNYN